MHVNISGAGVTAHAPHAAGRAEVSRMAVAAGSAGDVRGPESRISGEPGGEGRSRIVLAWGEFKPSPMNVAQAGELQAAAVQADGSRRLSLIQSRMAIDAQPAVPIATSRESRAAGAASLLAVLLCLPALAAACS